MRTAIKNSGGVKGSLLIPDAPFELLVRRALTRLLPLALQCKEFVNAELLKIAGQCSPPDVDRFPTLQVWSCDVLRCQGVGLSPALKAIREVHAWLMLLAAQLCM